MATAIMSSNNPFLQHPTNAATGQTVLSTHSEIASKDPEMVTEHGSHSTQASTDTSSRPELQPTDSFTLDQNFHPTHCIFIPRHWGTTQRIPIYDITSAVDLTTYPSIENKDIESWFSKANAAGLEQVKQSSSSEKYAVHRANWYGNNFTVRQPSTSSISSSSMVTPAANSENDGRTTAKESTKKGSNDSDIIVDWKGGWHSGRRNRLLFPTGSRHSTHDITMKSDNYIKFREIFVVESCRYEWHCLNRFSMRQFRCDMVLAGGIVKTVARMWQPRKDWLVQSGVLVLEASAQSGLDEVVLLSTAMVVLRKTRQKAYEYSN